MCRCVCVHACVSPRAEAPLPRGWGPRSSLLPSPHCPQTMLSGSGGPGAGVGSRPPPAQPAGEGGEPTRRHPQAALREGAPTSPSRYLRPVGVCLTPAQAPWMFQDLRPFGAAEQPPAGGQSWAGGLAPSGEADRRAPTASAACHSPHFTPARLLVSGNEPSGRNPRTCPEPPAPPGQGGPHRWSLAPLGPLPGPARNRRHTSMNEAAAPAGPRRPRQGWPLVLCPDELFPAAPTSPTFL